MFRRDLLFFVVILAVWSVYVDARKSYSGHSRLSSSRGSSTRHLYPQYPAPSYSSGTSLSGWQNQPRETSYQSSGNHQRQSYGNSATRLSGNQPLSYQQSVRQRHSYPQNSKPQQTHTYPQNNHRQQTHSYSQNNAQPKQNYPSGHSNPSSNSGLSGSGGSGATQFGNSGGGHQAGGYGNKYHPQTPPPYSPPVHSNPVYNRPHTYSQNNAQPRQNNPLGHSYPSSNTGLSGSGGTGAKYPGNSGGGYQAGGYGNNYHQQAPPPYSPPVYSNPVYNRPQYNYPVYNHPQYSSPTYGHGGYGGGYGGGGYGGYNGIGSFGGYNYGGMRRGTSTLTKVGIAGASVGTVLTGLALWNLARSGNKHTTHIYQDHRGNPIPLSANPRSTSPVDPLLSELVNCTLTISGSGETEVISIPCAIATSFSPTSDLNKGVDKSDSTQEAKCTVTVVKKDGTELSTTIPCSIFLNTAKQANVTEPPPLAETGTNIQPASGLPLPYAPVAPNEPGTSYAPGAPYVPGAPYSPGAPYTPGAPYAPGAPYTPGAPYAPEGPITSPNISQPPQQPIGIGPPLDVPLAPFPNEQAVNQGGAGYLAPYPNPVGLPYGAPLQLPPCKLEPGETQDPLSPCPPASGAVTPSPTSAAYFAAAAA